jgi:hypothetical protein
MTTVNWPSFFPPKCPPSEARDAFGEVFRLVYTQPPSVRDFESYAQMRPKEYMGNCEASGLSVFTAKADALRMVRRVQALAKQGKPVPAGDLVASANLSAEAGKLMHTPRDGNSHHTWWAPDGFDHAAAFKVVS